MLRLALDALRVRAQKAAILGMTFGLFTYAAIVPERPRIAVAVLFAVLVYAPTWWRKGE